jgi:hypothetical protein
MVSEPEMASSEGAEKWSVCADNCMKWLVSIIFEEGRLVFEVHPNALPKVVFESLIP